MISRSTHTCYVYVHGLAAKLYSDENPMPLTNYGDIYEGNEIDQINSIAQILERCKEIPSRYSYSPGEFSPRNDLKIIAKWVRWNEKQYMAEYSSENAYCFIDRIYYWFCRWDMETTAARVQKVIADLREEVPSRYKKDYENRVKQKKTPAKTAASAKKKANLVSSGLFRVKDWPYSLSIDTHNHLAVAIHPNDRSYFSSEEQSEGHLYVHIDKKIFTCFESKEVTQGTLGFKSTGGGLFEAKKFEVNPTTLNGTSYVSPRSVNPQDYMAGKIFVKVHLSPSESAFSKQEYKERLIENWKKNCLQLGATYGLETSVDETSSEESSSSSSSGESLSDELSSDESSSNHSVNSKSSPVFTVLKMKDRKNGAMHSAFLAEDTKIKLFIDQSQFFTLRDEIITNTEEAVFTFKVSLDSSEEDPDMAVFLEAFGGLLDKKPKKMEYKEEEIDLKIREKIDEEYLSVNQAIVLKKKDNVHAILAQVKIGEKIYKADEFLNSKAGKGGMSIQKFALHPSSKIVFENGCPEKISLIPPEIICQDLSEQKSFSEFLVEEGLIGLPEGLETNLTPILYGRGELGGILEERGIHASRGLVLYGLPGSGKTTFATKLAKYLGVPASRLQMISATELLNQFVGGTEEKIRELFAPANKAYADLGDKSPLYIVVIDEIDALLGDRSNIDSFHEHNRGIVNQFLSCLDGFVKQTNLLVIGMTNDLTHLDKALLRPGRLGVQIEIPFPDQENREGIFAFYLDPIFKANAVFGELDIGKLAAQAEGLSGAEIKGIVEEVNRVTFAHIVQKKRRNKDASIEELKQQEDSCITQEKLELAIQKMHASKKASISEKKSIFSGLTFK